MPRSQYNSGDMPDNSRNWEPRDMYVDAQEVRDVIASQRGIRRRNSDETVLNDRDDAYDKLSGRSRWRVKNIRFNALGRWMFIGGEKPSEEVVVQ
jgi:hypothetical protein